MQAANATVAALTKLVSTTRKAPQRQSTRISALWAAFDSAESAITSKHLPVLAEKTGLNVTTVRCQFYAWRATRAS